MEGWFQPTKPRRQEAHVAALFTGPTSFAAAICTLQGYSECTRILASRQKISCSWKHLCGEAIYFSCIFLAKAGFCSAITTGDSCRQGRGQSQDNRKLIHIGGCNKRIALTSGRTSQFIILPFISGRVSARALVPGLIAPGGQLLCPAAGVLLL